MAQNALSLVWRAKKKASNLFCIDYTFMYMKNFDLFNLDLLYESYGQSCFLSNQRIFLKK